MKKLIITLLTACILFLGGCIPSHLDTSKERAAFDKAVSELFTALDNENEEAVYELFSSSAKEDDREMVSDIAKLIDIYPSPTAENGYDGLVMSDSSWNDGEKISSAECTFPVRCGEDFYWFRIKLMYENTVDEDEIGITQLDFFTAEEYCICYHGNGVGLTDDPGVNIHAEKAVDGEVHCIESFPRILDTRKELLDANRVRSFLKSNQSYSDFSAQYDEPNSAEIFTENETWYYYKLFPESGNTRYLILYTTGDRIYEATVVDHFRYIDSLYSE